MSADTFPSETDTRPEPLGKSAFHGPVGEYVQTVSPHSEGDPAAILTQCLAGVGALVGRRRHIQVEATPHYGTLYVCIVGRTAKARKGTSYDWAGRLIGVADPELQILNGLSSGEGLIDYIRDASEGDPGEADQRAVFLETEFASILRKLERQGNTLSSTLRTAWDGKRIGALTKGLFVRSSNHTVAIIAHITNYELQELLKATEIGNGLGNRFLWIHAERSKKIAVPVPLDEKTDRHLDALADLIATNARRREGRIGFDEEGESLWSILYEAEDDEGGAVGALTARHDPQVLRLALIYACADGAEHIGIAHVMAASAVAEYARQTVRHIWGDNQNDPVRNRILSALKRNGSMTRTEIREGLYSNHLTAARLDAAIVGLESEGLIETSTKETGGRPGQAFRIAEGIR